jgi:hypothetical protein
MRTIPNFFIVGAPRAGTTAMLHYLSEHPQVFTSVPKELLFWATDFPDAQRSCYVRIDSVDQYVDQFSHATQGHRAVGEGTATYLYSREAIPNILRFNPAARIIVMLRNPADLVPSWHGELLYNRYEDEPDLERAWHLQEARSAGRRIPRGCYVPQFLQYRDVASLGTQLARLQQMVKPGQLLVVWYDDFAPTPQLVYEKVLSFLDLEPDHRTTFPVINSSKELRWRWVGELVFRPPRAMEHPVRLLRKVSASPGFQVTRILRRFLARPRSRLPLNPSFADELRRTFESELCKLEELTGRSLASWRLSPLDPVPENSKT